MWQRNQASDLFFYSIIDVDLPGRWGVAGVFGTLTTQWTGLTTPLRRFILIGALNSWDHGKGPWMSRV